MATFGRATGRRRIGFTLIELVIVVVIIGVVAAIAIPSLSSGAERAGDAALRADSRELQSAVDRYAADHQGRGPNINPDGSSADQDTLKARLTSKSDEDGAINDSGLYGSYLLRVPLNPRTTCPMINVGPWSDNTDCSWRLDPDSLRVRPDHTGAENGSW